MCGSWIDNWCKYTGSIYNLVSLVATEAKSIVGVMSLTVGRHLSTNTVVGEEVERTLLADHLFPIPYLASEISIGFRRNFASNIDHTTCFIFVFNKSVSSIASRAESISFVFSAII